MYNILFNYLVKLWPGEEKVYVCTNEGNYSIKRPAFHGHLIKIIQKVALIYLNKQRSENSEISGIDVLVFFSLQSYKTSESTVLTANSSVRVAS